MITNGKKMELTADSCRDSFGGDNQVLNFFFTLGHMCTES